MSRRCLSWLMACLSVDPARPGWFGFRDLASSLFSLQKVRCVHMRRRAGPVTEISVTELELFPIWTHPARIPGLSVTKHFQLHMACKVADKSERGSTGIFEAFWTFFISVTGIKSPIWTEDKIRPACQASPVTGLIWRGPYSSYICHSLLCVLYPQQWFKRMWFARKIISGMRIETKGYWMERGNRFFFTLYSVSVRNGLQGTTYSCHVGQSRT